MGNQFSEISFLRNQLTDDSAPSVGKRVFSCQNRMFFHVLAHFPPGSKRSFDVAFLAGSDDTNNKSAFTKYNNKERKLEKDVTISSISTNLVENTSKTVDNTTSSMILPNVSNPNLNMLQFPALRKLLDITGKKSR